MRGTLEAVWATGANEKRASVSCVCQPGGCIDTPLLSPQPLRLCYMPGKVVSTSDLMGGVAVVLMGPLCCALLFAAFVTMLVHPGALVLLNFLGCQTAE